LVEEAEPLRADLFARGYNVEVVFPDAEPSSPADLELRLEHCSPEQAIARVEADSGSPSRCVFLTHTKRPQRDLLLIEMTVLATGTDSRHPLYVPVSLPGTTLVQVPSIDAPKLEIPKIEIPAIQKGPGQDVPALATVLPFPEAALAVPCGQPVANAVAHTAAGSAARKSDEHWDKAVGAEVTAFLAHAPRVEPVSFPLVAMYSDLQSRVVKQVRGRWEVLSLFGVAAGVLLLLYIGWQAGPSKPWQANLEIVQAGPATAPVASMASVPVAPVPSKIALSLKPAVPTVHVQNHSTGRPDRWLTDQLIARDTIRSLGNPLKPVSISKQILAANKISAQGREALSSKPLPKTVSIRTQTTQASVRPIKKITDLK
jgi:hypothetical protein